MLELGINKIKDLTKRLCSANLLVVDKEVSLFLSELASDDTFKDIITQCNHNYFFDEDWLKLGTKNEIVLPHNKRQKIAFIIGLLYKFDIKNISIIDMLKTFYANLTDLQEAYVHFCQEILLPLQEAFISIIKGEPVELEDMQDSAPLILDKMNEDIRFWLMRLATFINQNQGSVLSPQDEKELLFSLKGFANYLESKDTALLKLLWLGLKNTLYKYHIGNKEIAEIEKLFELYGLDMGI